jgi:hypothetical protein
MSHPPSDYGSPLRNAVASDGSAKCDNAPRWRKPLTRNKLSHALITERIEGDHHMSTIITSAASIFITISVTLPCLADSIVIGSTHMHLVTMDRITREVTDHTYDFVENTTIPVDRGKLPILGPNFIPVGIAEIDDVRWPVALWMFDPVTGATRVCRAAANRVFQCN